LQEGLSSPRDGCAIFINVLFRARLLSELKFIEAVAESLESSAKSYAVVVSARSSASVDESASGARFLQSAAQPANTLTLPVPQIHATPTILAGLLLSLVLILVTAVGLSCVSSVDTPDIMHSFTLPAGKEY
jgi:hypothetical protein